MRAKRTYQASRPEAIPPEASHIHHGLAFSLSPTHFVRRRSSFGSQTSGVVSPGRSAEHPPIQASDDHFCKLDASVVEHHAVAAAPDRIPGGKIRTAQERVFGTPATPGEKRIMGIRRTHQPQTAAGGSKHASRNQRSQLREGSGRAPSSKHASRGAKQDTVAPHHTHTHIHRPCVLTQSKRPLASQHCVQSHPRPPTDRFTVTLDTLAGGPT